MLDDKTNVITTGDDEYDDNEPRLISVAVGMTIHNDVITNHQRMRLTDRWWANSTQTNNYYGRE